MIYLPTTFKHFFILGTSFGLGTLTNCVPNTLIHETGHYLAIKALFSNAHPKISLSFYSGGNIASDDNARQTRLGKCFKYDTCHGIISAAGPAFDVLNIALSIIIANRFSPSFASNVLMASAFDTAMSMAHYTLTEKNQTHDFYAMQEKFNIPISYFKATAHLIALLAFTALMSNSITYFSAFDSFCNRNYTQYC